MLKPSYNEVIYITTIRTYHIGANILYLNQCISLGCYNEVDLCNLWKIAQHNLSNVEKGHNLFYNCPNSQA